MTLLDSDLEDKLEEIAETWQALRQLNAGASESPADYVGTIEKRQRLERDLEPALLELGSRLVQAYVEHEEHEERDEPSQEGDAAPAQREQAAEPSDESTTVPKRADTIGLDEPSNEGPREQPAFVEEKIEAPPQQFSLKRSLETLSPGPSKASEPSPSRAEVQPSLTAAISRERSQGAERSRRRETGEPIGDTADAGIEVEARADQESHQPATTEQLERFKDQVNQGNFGTPDPEPDEEQHSGTQIIGYLPPETILFPDLKEEMEPVPDHINDARALELEIGVCQTVADERHRTRWRQLDDEVHRALMGLTVARMRRAQAVGPEYHGDGYVNERLAPVFRALTRHSEAHRPGYVHGLSKSHDPEKGTWDRDVAAWKEQLDDLAREYYGAEPADEQGPSREDIDRALTSLRDAFDADMGEEGIRKMVVSMVRSYLDEQTLAPDNERLQNLLDDRAEWFDEEEFPKLRHSLATRQQRDDEDAAEPSRFDNVAEALEAADEAFDGLHVWKSARKGAERSNYEDPDRVYRTLEAIAQVGDLYFDTATEGRSMGGSWGDMLQKHADVPIKYSAGEHQTTATMYAEDRHFTDPVSGKERTIERHVTVGQAKASSLQIFFAPSERDGEQIVDIGYCGPHLRFVSSNS